MKLLKHLQCAPLRSLACLVAGLTLAQTSLAHGDSWETLITAIDSHHPVRSEEKLQEEEALTNSQRPYPWNDPWITVGREQQNFLPAMGEPGPAPMWSLSVTQEIPWPGSKIPLQKERMLKLETTRIAQGQLQTERRFSLFETLVGITYEKKLIDIEADNIQTLKNIQASAQIRRRLGLASHQDILRLELEIAIAENSLTQSRRSWQQEQSILEVEAGTTLNAVQEFPSIPFTEGLQKAILGDGVDFFLAKAELQKRVGENRADQEELQTLPALSTSLAFMRNDNGMWMGNAMLGLRIPLFSRDIQQTQDSLRSIAARKETATTERLLKWREVAQKAHNTRLTAIAEQKTLLTAHLQPLMNNHLKATSQDFASTRASLNDFLEAQRWALSLRRAALTLARDEALEHLQGVKIAGGWAESTLRTPISTALAAFSLGMAGASSGEMSKMSKMGNNKASQQTGSMPPQQSPDILPLNEEESSSPSTGGQMGGMGM